jgi:hypothetical protein
LACDLGPKAAAAAQVLDQLPLDGVGEASTVLDDETGGFSLGTALVQMLEGGKNAPEDARPRARWRGPQSLHCSAVQMKASAERNSAHSPSLSFIELFSLIIETISVIPSLRQLTCCLLQEMTKDMLSANK